VSYHSFGPLNAAAAATATTNPPLLLIHGFASTQYDWPLAMLQTLGQDRQVVIFDNPRIGLSTDTSDSRLSIGYMSDTTLELAQALNLARPDILGYSLGGTVALQLAVDHGEEFGGVVAVATSFGGPDAPQPPGGLADALTRVQTVSILKWLAYTNVSAPASAPFTLSGDDSAAEEDPYKLLFPLGAFDPGWCTFMGDINSLGFAALLPTGSYPGAGYAVPAVIPAAAALVPTAEAAAAQHAALLEFFDTPSDVESALSSVSNQILYITGVQDDVIPVATQIQAAAMTPGAWLVQVPEGGHALPFLHPIEFAGTVTDFLAQAKALSPQQRSYYETEAASGALWARMSGFVVAVVAAACAMLV
jgi:pimeloyl-ACP methyl ester carboxylesterase